MSALERNVEKKRSRIVTYILDRKQTAQAKADAKEVARIDNILDGFVDSENDLPKLRRILLKPSVMDNPREKRKKEKILLKVQRHEARQNKQLKKL